jgi:hypothetical protein
LLLNKKISRVDQRFQLSFFFLKGLLILAVKGETERRECVGVGLIFMDLSEV